MTYDRWKTTNPADVWLGPSPDEQMRPRRIYRGFADLVENEQGQLECTTCGRTFGREYLYRSRCPKCVPDERRDW